MASFLPSAPYPNDPLIYNGGNGRIKKKKRLKKKTDQVHKINQLISPWQLQYMYFDVDFFFLIYKFCPKRERNERFELVNIGLC